MGAIARAAAWLGMGASLVIGTDQVTILPPSRSETPITADRALRTAAVFRAMQVLNTATSQLSVDVFRGDVKIPTPALITQPDLTMTGSGFHGALVMSLAGWGNALLEKITDPAGRTSSVRLIPPVHFTTGRNPETGRLEYHVADYADQPARTLTTPQVQHLGFLRVPGYDWHLGPVQAAQEGLLKGARDIDAYANNWFGLSGVPSGVLATDQALTIDQAKEALTIWEEVPAGQTRILGRGLGYKSTIIDPAAAQWIEARRFTKTDIADLFGIPGSLMLGADQGTSKTYANVEQDWIGFVRFTLMAYLREIEEALSALLPRGQYARFNVDSLLRTDTKTRYEAYQIALTAGFMDRDEIRALEHLPITAPAQIGPAA